MVSIRKAGIQDLKSLAILFDAYRVFYEKESDISGAEEFLKERIQNKESEIFVVVESNNDLLGFVQLYPIFSSTRMKRLWLLNDLFVYPEYRGIGISHQLIAMAKELCESTDACGLILETAQANEIGNNLYPSAGFTLDNEHNYYYWDNA